MLLYYVQTFGCQMNEYDSERISAVLESLGMLQAQDPFNADFVVLNTCSVREKPQHKVDSYIGRLRFNCEHKGKPSVIGIMGCVAQQEGDSFLRRFPCVTFVLGTDSLHLLPETAESALRGMRSAHTGWSESGFSVAPFTRQKKVSAFVTIMKGCDNFCSYCIVPYVRGREKSRMPAEILGEVQRLVDGGVRDITLLGQNVNSYGKELGLSFSKLLDQVARTEGLIRLRYMTSNPKDFSVELVEVMAKHKNICPYVHLPLQSGSDTVLKSMNRGYTWQKYYDNILAARKVIPGLAFSSDIITGFPGETERDFQDTFNAVAQIEYETLFVFNYSPRPGTAAEKLADDVPLEIKTSRLEALVNLQEAITARRYKNIAGGKVSVLVEGASIRSDGTYTGRTIHNRIVNFTAIGGVKEGTEAEITITEIKRNTLFGNLEQ